MQDTETIIVDTQGFVNSCKNTPARLILTKACEQCEHHRGIIEVWPGKDGQTVKVKAAGMTLKTFVNSDNVDTGKNRSYDIICGRLNRNRAAMIDTLEFVTPCKRTPGLLITASSCEKCKHHNGIMQISIEKNGQVSDIQKLGTTLKTFVENYFNETGQNIQYDILCGLPGRCRSAMFAKFSNPEV